MDSDIAIVKTSVAIAYSNLIRPASIAGSRYNLPDNQVVWAVGFGSYAVSLVYFLNPGKFLVKGNSIDMLFPLTQKFKTLNKYFFHFNLN